MNEKAEARKIVPPFLVALAAFVLACAMRAGLETSSTNDIALASAWLHGHAWVHYPGPSIDAVPFHGRAYVVEGPAPALLLLPIVFGLGSAASQSMFCNLVGALGAWAMYRVARRAGVGIVTSIAATAFGFFGTSFFTCATRGDVWFLAHVCAFTFTLLALDECAHEGRPWLVAAYAAIAAFSRYPLLLALPAYAVLLGSRERSARPAVAYVASLLPAFALSAWYNLARWGTLGDPGFGIWYRAMDERAKMNQPMFSAQYLAPQLKRFALRLPDLGSAFPYVTPPHGGFSILITSLPLAYACRAGANVRTFALALCALATAIPSLLYYDSGQVQYGMRHALDFEPFLYALLVTALARRPSRVVTALLFVFAAFGAIEGIVWLRAAFGT